jgi:hypothetical protein
MNTNDVATLYRSDPIVQGILDHAASLSRGGGTLTLDRATTVLPYGRRDLTKAMRRLARTGAGTFVVGRRGNVSRLRWTTPPKDLQRAVTTIPAPPSTTPPAMPMLPKMTPAEALHMADMFMQLSDYLEKGPAT